MAEVRGGPADGLDVPLAGAFRWIHPVLRRGFELARPGTALYRRGRGVWEFMGFEAWRCEGCGALVLARVSCCPLCKRERVVSGAAA